MMMIVINVCAIDCSLITLTSSIVLPQCKFHSINLSLLKCQSNVLLPSSSCYSNDITKVESVLLCSIISLVRVLLFLSLFPVLLVALSWPLVTQIVGQELGKCHHVYDYVICVCMCLLICIRRLNRCCFSLCLSSSSQLFYSTYGHRVFVSVSLFV